MVRQKALTRGCSPGRRDVPTRCPAAWTRWQTALDGLLIGSDRGASAFPRPSAAVHPNLLRNVVSAPLEMRYTASPAGEYSYFVRLRQVVAVLALRPIMYSKGNCKH